MTDKEYQCTAYLLFCHLCSKMTLEEEVMSHFIQTLFSSPRSDTLDSLLQTYLIVKRSNRTTIESIEGSLSSDCLYEFLSNDQLLYYWKRIQNNVTVLHSYLATQFSVEFDTLFATLSVQKQHLNELINAVFNGSEHMMVDQGMTLYHALHHTENNVYDYFLLVYGRRFV